MRFRWKLLILLLTIAMLPIMAMRTLGVRNVRQLSNKLVSQAKDDLVLTTQNRLRLLADSYSLVSAS